MTKVKFTGWEPYVRKIRFTMLLHEEGGLTLREAKDIKDKVVGGGEVIEIDFGDTKTSELIYAKAREMGVKCEVN